MPQLTAKAYPRKNFFVQMFTKDISLEDCVLDLIDNSVDGFIKSRGLRLSQIASGIWRKNGHKPHTSDLPTIHVGLTEDAFEIRDNCGGIDLNEAENEVFNFGHALGWKSESLGVYGVGLKRALFKLGDHFEISSQTRKNGFHCSLPVDEWVKKDDSLDDWTIPLTVQRPAASFNTAGTKIRVDRLHDEVKFRVKSGTIESSLCRAISTTFCFFLERYIRIFVNGKRVYPLAIPTSRPSKGSVSFERFSDGEVQIRILATIASQDDSGHYDQTKAGWYIVCNGRAVLSADKSELTGWGEASTPTFQPKHRGFVGIVFFECKDPMLLPWTTTKRSLNRESAIYLRTRNKMAVAAKPVFSFINKKYPTDPDQAPLERVIARDTVIASPAELATQRSMQFKVVTHVPAVRTTKRVQYDAKIADLDKITKHLRQPWMSASAVGEHTFKYFLTQEGLA
jgi:Histidine kinase-, DNA gyrase B-, and HSP90-like ATPase